MTDRFNALSLSHRFLAEHVRPGDLCIDATAGRGYDTAYLAGLTGETGRVLAFDIQQEAVDSTNALLRKRGLDRIAQVHLDSHVNMERYAQPGTVRCITFNFGWLPAGDHSIFAAADPRWGDEPLHLLRQGQRIRRAGRPARLSAHPGQQNLYRPAARLYQPPQQSASVCRNPERNLNRFSQALQKLQQFPVKCGGLLGCDRMGAAGDNPQPCMGNRPGNLFGVALPHRIMFPGDHQRGDTDCR